MLRKLQGGPGHQVGVGAPLKQINTRASPHPPTPPLSITTAHTLSAGTSNHIMRVTHSPLIGRDGKVSEKPMHISTKSRAGFITDNEDLQNILSGGKTDIRKADESLGSLGNSYEKSPMMINDRLEKFVDSSILISKWDEGDVTTKEYAREGKGARRRSRRMSELCSKFEPTRVGPDVHFSTDDGGGVVGDSDNEIRKSTERGLKTKNIARNFENFDEHKNFCSLEPVLDNGK